MDIKPQINRTRTTVADLEDEYPPSCPHCRELSMREATITLDQIAVHPRLYEMTLPDAEGYVGSDEGPTTYCPACHKPSLVRLTADTLYLVAQRTESDERHLAGEARP